MTLHFAEVIDAYLEGVNEWREAVYSKLVVVRDKLDAIDASHEDPEFNLQDVTALLACPKGESIIDHLELQPLYSKVLTLLADVESDDATIFLDIYVCLEALERFYRVSSNSYTPTITVQ
jgi:hypothetical protein